MSERADSLVCRARAPLCTLRRRTGTWIAHERSLRLAPTRRRRTRRAGPITPSRSGRAHAERLGPRTQCSGIPFRLESFPVASVPSSLIPPSVVLSNASSPLSCKSRRCTTQRCTAIRRSCGFWLERERTLRRGTRCGHPGSALCCQLKGKPGTFYPLRTRRPAESTLLRVDTSTRFDVGVSCAKRKVSTDPASFGLILTANSLLVLYAVQADPAARGGHEGPRRERAGAPWGRRGKGPEG